MNRRTKTGFPQNQDIEGQATAQRFDPVIGLAIGRQRFHRTDGCHRNGLQWRIGRLRRRRAKIGTTVVRLSVLLHAAATRTAVAGAARAATRVAPTAAPGCHGQRKNSDNGQKQLSHNAVLCGTKWHSPFPSSGYPSWTSHNPQGIRGCPIHGS